LVLRLPAHLIINLDTALKSERAELYQRLMEEEDVHEDTILILFILSEKNKQNSLWKPYFDTLPEV
jgi:hypothetical protein